jgi:hypothetical protein
MYSVYQEGVETRRESPLADGEGIVQTTNVMLMMAVKTVVVRIARSLVRIQLKVLPIKTTPPPPPNPHGKHRDHFYSGPQWFNVVNDAICYRRLY